MTRPTFLLYVAAVLLLPAALLWSMPPGDYSLALISPVGEKSEKARIDEHALRRIPEILGIPHSTVSAPEKLQDFDVAVMAAGPANNRLTAPWENALYQFVDDGGILLIPGPAGSRLYPLLGINSIVSTKKRERIIFHTFYDDPLLAYIDHPNEKTISLGNGYDNTYNEVIWSHGAESDGMGAVLASFPDGSAALVRNYYGRGIAYFLGVSFEETVMLPQTGGDYEAQRLFVNSVEPSADTIMLLVKALYEGYAKSPVAISAVPQARSTALLLSHDIDAQTSFMDSLKFAALEEKYGARGTYFINTKYFTDAADIGYYIVPENLQAVRELARRGHEIGSHTVAHSYDFTRAPAGTPNVNFANYHPQKGITINGEARVSKELLDRDIRGQNTGTFRAGYLAFPPELIEILESSGYAYDSSFSANDVLTSFPYFAFTERRPGSAESQIIEIPVTLDDALDFLTEDTIEDAVTQWKKVHDANADNNSITVLLVHPSDTRNRSFKLEAQEALMAHAAAKRAWMGAMGEFGDFWRDRSTVRIIGAESSGNTLTIRLNQKKESVHPLTGFEVPGNKNVTILDVDGTLIPSSSRFERGKTYISLHLGQLGQ